jgi:hypothetical protein
MDSYTPIYYVVTLCIRDSTCIQSTKVLKYKICIEVCQLKVVVISNLLIPLCRLGVELSG